MSDEQPQFEKFCQCEDRFRRKPRKDTSTWDNTDRFIAGQPDAAGGAYCPICRPEQAEAARKLHEAWVVEQIRRHGWCY